MSDGRNNFSTSTHLGLVKVVNKVLDNGSSVGGLNVLAVVGDHSTRGGTDNNSALLTLFPERNQSCHLWAIARLRIAAGEDTYLLAV